MIQTGWWLADVASQLLEPHERDAVRGDLAECGAGGWRALREVLGLVARRQAALWADWRPWIAVIAIVVPIGLMLSHGTRWWADSNAVYISLYIKVWQWSDLGYPGWRHDLWLLIWYGTTSSMAIAGWSWTTGYALALLSRRTVWIAVTLFALAVFLGTLGTTTIARANSGTFAGHFFRIVFPRLVRTLFVLVPAVWGIRTASRGALPLRKALVGGAILAALTLLASDGLEDSFVHGRGIYPSDPGPDGAIGSADDPRPLWPLSLVMLWPTAFIVSTLWLRARPFSSHS